MNAEDAIEFMLAGASAIQVGTASFIDPRTAVMVIKGIEEYLELNGFYSSGEIVGNLQI